MTSDQSQTSFDLDIFLENLTTIQNTPGKNDKRSLLKDLCVQQEPKSILEQALNPRFPMCIGEETTLSMLSGITSKVLLDLPTRQKTEGLSLAQLMQSLKEETIPRGYNALAHLQVWLDQHCSTDSQKHLVLSLIQKNPRLGVSWHSFTKVTGTAKFEVMLAKDINKVKKMDEKVQFPVYVQPKLDGYRAIAKTNSDGEWELFSRNGKKYENFPDIIEELEKHGDPETVYDGEIMSDDFQSMQRTAFAVKKKRTVGDVVYHIFDTLQDNEFARKACYRVFNLRMHQMEGWFDHAWENGLNKMVLVPTVRCESWEEVYQTHKQFLEDKFEGTIVRLDKMYEFKRTDSLMKIKEMKSQDCFIHQVIEGKGKYRGSMGAVKVLQEDNQTLCEVGTGFTDKMREEFWRDRRDIVHKAVEIKYQELSPDGVMRFPVFLRFREDKETL